MFMFTLKLWFGLSVLVAGLAYYHRPQFPDTVNNRMLKEFTGLYMKFMDLTCTLGNLLGYNRVNIVRAMLEGPSKLDKKDDSVEEYTTTMDGVEVMVFRPTGSRGKVLPGIVHYHGGGWVLLTPTSYGKVLRSLVRHTQSVIVSVNYRRAPEHVYPIPLEDCLRATRYFLKNTDKYGVDKNKIGIKGDSAGGNLAMAATLRLTQDDDDSLPSLRLMSLDYPALQMVDLNLPSYRQYETGPCFVSKRPMLYYWLLYSVGQPVNFEYLYSNLCANNHTSRDTKKSELYSKNVAQSLVPRNLPSGPAGFKTAHNENQEVIERLERFATDIYFSPLAASDKQLSRLPPTYIMNAEFDVLRDDGFILAERLKKVGVPVEHKYYPTEEHGFLNLVNLDPLATEEAVNFGRYFNKTISSV